MATGRARPLARVLLHADLDRDPGADAARGRPRDRLAFARALAVHRRHRPARRPALPRELLAPLCDGAHRHPHRSAHARAAVHGVPPLSPRVLRPARHRPGALARDERPLPHPLLHRLGPRARHAKRDDDLRRGHGARAREPTPRALHGGRDAADHRPRTAVRASRVAALPRGAGAEGQRHGGGGRVRRGDRDGAGVRSRRRRPRPLRREGGGGARHGAAPGRRRGEAPAGALLPAVALDRRSRLLRRPAGDRRAPLDRRVRPLRDAPAAARVAARSARLDHEPRPTRARVGGPQLRVARGDPAAARARGTAAPARRAGRRALRGSPLRVRGRGGGSA